MCESSKARRPDTEWVPGALLPGLTGRTTESAALHPYPIGRTCPAMDFFTLHGLPRASHSAPPISRCGVVYHPQAFLRRYCPEGQLLLRGGIKAVPFPSTNHYHGRRTAPQLDLFYFITSWINSNCPTAYAIYFLIYLWYNIDIYG
jgi:hypothetical protein